MDSMEIYRDINKSVMEISWRAINATFLINGASATALLAHKEYISALTFGFGALVSILCFGFAYFAQLAIAETWRPQEEQQTYYVLPFVNKIKISAGTAEHLRKVTIALWLMSVLLFLLGLIIAVCTLPISGK